MPSIRSSRRVKREVMQRYDENPEGWQVRLGKDRKGFLDLLILHGNESWQVKEFQVNPYKVVGYGASTLTSPLSPLSSLLPDRSAHQFGLRPLTEAWMRELATSIDDPKTVMDIMSKLLRAKPVPTDEAMRSQVVLEGPIIQSSGDLCPISEAQKELDRTLRRQLEKLVARKYRHALTPYI